MEEGDLCLASCSEGVRGAVAAVDGAAWRATGSDREGTCCEVGQMSGQWVLALGEARALGEECAWVVPA